jgi:integrase
MPLTNTAIQKAKTKNKPYKVFDERGLFLLVKPNGGKLWRFKYRFNGKEKQISLGVYPDVSLKNARDRRDDARNLVANGIDPSEYRKAQKEDNGGGNCFEAVAREWFAKNSPSWSANHADRIKRRLENDIFPWIGGKPIGSITIPELLSVIRRIENRGALETAHRALGNCSQVFRYAVATGRAERDPTGDLRGALPPSRGQHFAAVTDPKQVGEMLQVMDGYEGSLIVRCALQLAPLVFVRPGELRKAEWKDIDLEAAEWSFMVTKTDTQHIVPLSRQAVEILKELQPLTGNGRYLFPGARSKDRPMSDNAILAAMRRMGIAKEEMSGHGFRAMARTILDEVLAFRPDFIEHQLAHAVRDPNGRAYNRTAHLPERRKMMQDWADYLGKLKAGVKIIPFHQRA